MIIHSPNMLHGSMSSCLWAEENCHTAILHDVLFMCGPETQFQIERGMQSALAIESS